MTDVSVVDRLAALPTFAAIPREQLEWLAAHGQLRRLAPNEVLFSYDHPPTGCYVVLAGHMMIRVVRDGMTRTINELSAGDLGGRLPYSRMPTRMGAAPAATAMFTVAADEPTELLLIDQSNVREMTRECYDVTQQCVHHMIDRTRLFTSDTLEREKMASLGRLAAGLAHELNNPSSAALRSARVLDACRREVVAATQALSAAGVTGEGLSLVEGLEARSAAASVGRSPLETADREDALSEWLEARGLDTALAEPLACAAIGAADLEPLATALAPHRLPAALRYLAANATARQLTVEIENATQRIDLLVAAVKRHTHMDRAPVDAIDLKSTLADTLTLADAKARAGAVSMELAVEPDLPTVAGVPGQLNDVWLNLVDNAIDATPTGGRILVSARRKADTVVVCVTDNGPGIPKENHARIFEPFFTTKPVGQGAGLGLDIAQRVIRSHGGSVELSSRPGHTEFRVTLPLARQPELDSSEQISNQPGTSAARLTYRP